jgi:hypothetical protein
MKIKAEAKAERQRQRRGSANLLILISATILPQVFRNVLQRWFSNSAIDAASISRAASVTPYAGISIMRTGGAT